MIKVDKEELFYKINVEGAFDSFSAKDARETFATLAETIDRNIILELNNCDFVDSSGIGALIFLHKRLRCKGFNISITNVSEQPYGLFTLLGLEKIFQISVK